MAHRLYVPSGRAVALQQLLTSPLLLDHTQPSPAAPLAWHPLLWLYLADSFSSLRSYLSTLWALPRAPWQFCSLSLEGSSPTHPPLGLFNCHLRIRTHHYIPHDIVSILVLFFCFHPLECKLREGRHSGLFQSLLYLRAKCPGYNRCSINVLHQRGKEW